MGANLRIEDNQGNKHCSFRDGYNNSNLLWMLGGSYWEMADDCKTDQEKIAYIKERLERYEEVKESRIDGDIESRKLSNNKQKWVEYFDEKYKELTAFVERAENLKKGEVIVWSV